MTQREFDEIVEAAQNVQKRHNWREPEWQAAHEQLREAVLTFKGIDIDS